MSAVAKRRRTDAASRASAGLRQGAKTPRLTKALRLPILSGMALLSHLTPMIGMLAALTAAAASLVAAYRRLPKPKKVRIKNRK